MKFFLLFAIFIFGCLPYADFREYHYSRPQIPFQGGISQQPQASQQIGARYYGSTNYANTLVQSYGQAGTAQIARQYQTSTGTQGHSNGYGPNHGGSQGSYNIPDNVAYAIASSYYPQQQQQLTPNMNPLTQHSQYTPHQHQTLQQHGSFVSLPQVGAYHNTGNYPYNQQQAATGSYNGAGSRGGSQGGSQVGGHTFPLNGNFVSQSEAGQLHSYQHQQQPVGDTRPFSRQITTCLPNGQCEQKTLPGGQVDQHRQQTVHTTRAKTVPKVDKCRQIAEAKKAAAASYAGGSYNFGPQYGGGGFQSGDGRTGGFQNGGGQNGGFQNGGGQNGGGQNADSGNPNLKRPKDRRLFPYSEVVLPNDPYN